MKNASVSQPLKRAQAQTDLPPMRTLLALGLACLLCLAAAAAPDPEQDAALAQLVANVERCQRAQARLAELEAVYTRGMTAHKLVGEPREEVVEGIARARHEVAEAREEHDELFEAARKSGVPWSVLDRYEQLPAPPAAAAPVGENADAAADGRAEDSDAMAGKAENVDAAPSDEGESPDQADGARSGDSDDLRATSRSPD